MKNLLLVFFAILFAGCSQEPYFEKINSFELHSTNDSSIVFVANFNVFNPNNFDIMLNEFEYSVIYDTCIIAIGFSNENNILSSNTSNPINTTINLEFEKLIPYIEEISNSDSIVLLVEFNANVTKFRKNISRTFTIVVNSADIVKNFISDDYFSQTYSIKSAQLKNVSMQTSTFEVLIEFTNPLPIDYQVKNITFDIFDDETKANLVGNSAKEFDLKIKKDSSLTIPIEITLNNINMAFSMFGKIMSGNFSYFIEGEVELFISNNELKLPLKQTVSSNN